jgi:hypothetical protein
MKKITTLMTGILLFALAACEPPEQEQAQQDQRQQQMQMQMVQSTAEFNSQMEQLLERYFDLKDALVESDAEAAAGYAEQFREFADGVDASTLNAETRALWVGYSEVIAGSSADLIGQADVDDQRYHFEYISEAMIEMTVTFQPVGYTVYHQSCPMVRDGSADWLSREEEISNPYHGDRMMRCGETIRRI